MHRIDQDGHVANRFSEGNPALGQQPTRVGEAWLNAVQEEIAAAIEGSGASLSKANNAQLAAVFSGIRARLGAIEGNVDGEDEWTYPAAKLRSVLVPIESAMPHAAVGAGSDFPHGWMFDQAGYYAGISERAWLGGAQGAFLSIPIGHLIPSGATQIVVDVLAKPAAAARATNDRLRVEAVRQTFAAAWPAVPVTTVDNSARDNGLANLQRILTSYPGAFTHDRTLYGLVARITCGLHGVQPDVVAGLRVTYRDPGPRNA